MPGELIQPLPCAETVVASDFNSIGDCVYDAASDVLYVLDNALEASGSLTGDTVFAIPAASTAGGLSAVGLESFDQCPELRPMIEVPGMTELMH